MSAKILIDGVECNSAGRYGSLGGGTYTATFSRDKASIEQIEAINWEKPTIVAQTNARCGLSSDYGYKVTDITYNHFQRTYAVRLAILAQYNGDVTAYQAEVADLNSKISDLNSTNASLTSQLAESDATVTSLYEQLAETDAALAELYESTLTDDEEVAQ